MTKRGKELRALAAGRRSARTREMPPGYVALIQRLMTLIVQWCEEQATLPDLRWLDSGNTAFIGPLQGTAVKYIADSPDAFRLVAWLDEQTHHEGTLFQLDVALRQLGHLPSRADSAEIVSTRHDGQRPCPHCGANLDGTTGTTSPSPGDFSICSYCCGFMRFGDDLVLVPISEADLEALIADGCGEEVATLRKLRDRFRAARMNAKGGEA
jgi:hypothetical protein